MWLIIPSLAIALLLPSAIGMLFAVAIPLLVDFLGRCSCYQTPLDDKSPIKISILSQGTGIIGFLLFVVTFDFAGVVLGMLWAGVFQVAAAKWFVKYLRMVALHLDQPQIVAGLDQLRQRLIATTLSAYGTLIIAIVVFTCALVLGLIAYVIGLIITLPIAFLLVAPLVVISMVLYFIMLYSYEKSLSDLRRIIRLQNKEV
jgi:hypothetical protein